jgi:hypothetical protein
VIEDREQVRWAWLARRVAYLVGAAVGVGLIASGRVTQDDVDGWLPLVTELAGAVVTVGFSFAAWRTGPHSDNSRPVIDADGLEQVFDLLEQMVDKAAGAPNRPGTPPPAVSEPSPAPVEGEHGPVPSTGESASLLDDLYKQIHGRPRPGA